MLPAAFIPVSFWLSCCCKSCTSASSFIRSWLCFFLTHSSSSVRFASTAFSSFSRWINPFWCCSISLSNRSRSSVCLFVSSSKLSLILFWRLSISRSKWADCFASSSLLLSCSIFMLAAHSCFCSFSSLSFCSHSFWHIFKRCSNSCLLRTHCSSHSLACCSSCSTSFLSLAVSCSRKFFCSSHSCSLCPWYLDCWRSLSS